MPRPKKIALFRFRVIASLVLEPLPRGELTPLFPLVLAIRIVFDRNDVALAGGIRAAAL
jgi:hypothetical protein